MAVLTPWVVASRDAAVTGVASINGKQGDVTLEEAGIAASGENKDITSLGGLVGPLRLNAQGVDEYDAVTVGQLNAAVAGGTGGVTASGVVSDFIGAVEWWQGSASSIPSGYVPANGQLLDRSKYPDLWSMVKAGILTSVTQRTYASTDAAWLAEPSSRAFYSFGDGDKDTGNQFRVPDLNGVWNDSVNPASYPGLFLRGSGVANLSGYGEGAVGVIRQSSAPNVNGAIPAIVPSGHYGVVGGGPFAGTANVSVSNAAPIYGQNKNDWTSDPNLMYTDTNGWGWNFSLQQANPVYGQDGNTKEIRPVSVTGIWIIRANGNFTSADTDFNVTRSDESLPAAGTTVLTGNVIADYAAAGDTVFNVQLTGKKVMGNTDNDFAQLNINDGEMSKSTTYNFPFTGTNNTIVTKETTGMGEGQAPGKVNSILNDYNDLGVYAFKQGGSATDNLYGNYGCGIDMSYGLGTNSMMLKMGLYVVGTTGVVKSSYRAINSDGTMGSQVINTLYGTANPPQATEIEGLGSFVGEETKTIREELQEMRKLVAAQAETIKLLTLRVEAFDGGVSEE